MISRAMRARKFPLTASGSICVILTFTIANSAATKKAFRKMIEKMRSASKK
jgi:hypothetical protein